MKANQSFRENDDAVSPVIGVILMVAITVVLAAVVFVLVGDLGQDAGTAPQASFQSDKSGTGGEVLVVKVGSAGIDAGTLDVQPSTCVLKDSSGTNKTSGSLAAGDYLQCSADGPVSIVDQSSNTLLYSGTI